MADSGSPGNAPYEAVGRLFLEAISQVLKELAVQDSRTAYAILQRIRTVTRRRAREERLSPDERDALVLLMERFETYVGVDYS